MIDILDVYKAIDDGQSWAVVAYLADQISHFVDYKSLLLHWFDWNDLEREKPALQWDPVWDFKSGDSIDTRNSITKTPRNAMRDSEDEI